jgi:sortase A
MPTAPPSEIPVRIVIPALGLDAPVVPAQINVVKVSGQEYQQWLVPDEFASGWHAGSARLGEPGNTVFNGHHNVFGEVFGNLVEVEIGDVIQVYSSASEFSYQITNKMILPEKYEQLDVRMNNAQWILPSQDERLTLITCWPYESNTHRLIVVARPFSRIPLNLELK